MPRCLDSRTVYGLDRGRNVNWSTVLALTFNTGIWMLVAFALFILVQ